MKIVSQSTNAMPDASSKSTAADSSKGSLQSSFAAVIGATVAASAQGGDVKLGKAQSVDTKKTSSLESKKKSTPSGTDDATNLQRAVTESVPPSPVTPIVPVVSQVSVMPAKQDAVSTDISVVGGWSHAEVALKDSSNASAGDTQVAELAALPEIASADSGAAVVSGFGKSGSDLLVGEANAAASERLPVTLPGFGHSPTASPAQDKASAAIAKSASIDVTAKQPADSAQSTMKPVDANSIFDPTASTQAIDKSQRSEVMPSVAPAIQSASSATSAVSTAAATQPATIASSETGATLSVAQQTTATSLAVSQQPVMQSASVLATSSSPSNFKMQIAKSAAPGTTSQASGVAKGRAASADSRLSSGSDSNDDKTPSTDAGNGSFASRVVTPDAGLKESASTLKGAVDSAALAQSTQPVQVAPMVNSASSHSAPVPDAGTAAGTTLPQQTSSAEGTQAAHALNSAQLIQTVHGSEMKLGMQSAEFGNISINTSLNRQILSAQISMDHSALGHALAAHLPAIEEKLGSAYGIQAKVELRDTGSNSSLNDFGNRESSGDRRSQGGSTGTSTAVLQSPIGALTGSNFTSVSSPGATSSRLDIRI